MMKRILSLVSMVIVCLLLVACASETMSIKEKEMDYFGTQDSIIESFAYDNENSVKKYSGKIITVFGGIKHMHRQEDGTLGIHMKTQIIRNMYYSLWGFIVDENQPNFRKLGPDTMFIVLKGICKGGYYRPGNNEVLIGIDHAYIEACFDSKEEVDKYIVNFTKNADIDKFIWLE